MTPLQIAGAPEPLADPVRQGRGYEAAFAVGVGRHPRAIFVRRPADLAEVLVRGRPAVEGLCCAAQEADGLVVLVVVLLLLLLVEVDSHMKELALCSDVFVLHRLHGLLEGGRLLSAADTA